MANWTVTEDGLNYVMEYPNGFKRSIRQSQVTKNLKGALLEYASSQSPYRVLANGELYISSYTAGVSQIDFDNNGGDDWSVGFKIAPTSLQVPSGVTVDSIDYTVTFWSLGVDTALASANSLINATFSTNSNGAGVYDLDCVYNMSDGSTFKITKLVLVDDIGNILASVEAGGVTINSVSGLVIDISADITQVGVNYPIQWAANPISLLPQTGANVVLNIPVGTTDIVTILPLDSTFTNDYTAGGALVFSSITIS